MKIPIAQTITLAKTYLGLMETTRNDTVLEKFCNMAAMRIDARNTYKISCETIDIDCYRATLPSNTIEVISFRFPDLSGGCSGCCGGNPNTTPGTLDVNMSPQCGCPMWYVADRNVLTDWNGLGANASWVGNFFSYDTQAGILVFPTTLTATSVQVYFRGYNQDSNGIMLIEEYMEDAIACFAAYKFATSGMNARKYTPKQISDWSRLWAKQRNHIRGTENLIDHRQHKADASAIARSVLINPLMVLNTNP